MSVEWYTFWLRIAAALIIVGFLGSKSKHLSENFWVGQLFPLSFFLGVLLVGLIMLGAVFNL